MFIYVKPDDEHWTDKYICHENDCDTCKLRFRCFTEGVQEDDEGLVLTIDDFLKLNKYYKVKHIHYCCRLVTGVTRSHA